MHVILEDGDSADRAAASRREGAVATVQDTLSSFNRVDRSMLRLTNTASKTVLTVCGEPDAFVVAWQNDHNLPPYMTMCADNPVAGDVELLCGQRGEFEGDVVVTRREANDAIEHFIKTGQMTPLHRWREE